MPPLESSFQSPKQHPLVSEPTSNQKIDIFREELQARFKYEGLESITEEDVKRFYDLMQNPNMYGTDELESLFSTIEQLAGVEAFRTRDLAQEVVRQIGFYREELGL